MLINLQVYQVTNEKKDWFYFASKINGHLTQSVLNISFNMLIYIPSRHKREDRYTNC